MFTNLDFSNIGDHASELSIFYSETGPITNNWIAHQHNPVIINSNKARNAGLLIKENILYARPDADETQLKEAVIAAYVNEFTDRFEDGLNTLIGERGVKLSGGQRQRIAIARAILKNPSILILDEATSSLDTESEYLVQKAIDNLLADRTVLVIAHRLTTVENADTIVVMKDGQIVDVGAHNDLLKKDGVYTRLYKKQFKK